MEIYSGGDAQDLFTSGASSSTKPEGEIDIEELDDEKLLDVSSAIAVEKEIAADTIGTIFSATRTAFLPYVEQCTLELVSLLSHYSSVSLSFPPDKVDLPLTSITIRYQSPYSLGTR